MELFKAVLAGMIFLAAGFMFWAIFAARAPDDDSFRDDMHD